MIAPVAKDQEPLEILLRRSFVAELQETVGQQVERFAVVRVLRELVGRLAVAGLDGPEQRQRGAIELTI